MSLRPSILDPLFAPAAALPGIGPKTAVALDRLLGQDGRPARVVDLLFHLPSGAVTRELKGSIAEAPLGVPVTLFVQVTTHRPAPVGRVRAPYKVLVEDGTGDITLVFFGLPAPRVEKMLPVGARRFVSGTIELYDGHRQMVHPARILDERAAAGSSTIEAVYGLTEGVTSRLLAKYVGTALGRVPDLPEWQDAAWLERQDFARFGAALAAIHGGAARSSESADGRTSSGPAPIRPGAPSPGSAADASDSTSPRQGEGFADVDVATPLPRKSGLPDLRHPRCGTRQQPSSSGERSSAAQRRPGEGAPAWDQPPSGSATQPANPARRRLAYDELLASQLALALVRARSRRLAGRTNAGDGRLAARIVDALPFPLTGAQDRAVAEIRRDLGAEGRMLRLLQGDVGSGKTLVALLAMASAVEAGRQAALVAPTEILARQHADRIAALAEPAGLAIGVITGRDRPSERRASLAALVEGRLDIAVGTHALMGEEVAFRDLGLAVIDEQHRFGVHQRLALGRKGEAVDMLVMTATPIPRTLALSAFGDMDLTVLDEKPPGRRPIDTRLVSTERLDQVTDAIARAIRADDLVYWVCPLVAESEVIDVAAAEERYGELRAALGEDVVGLVHGKMASRAKDAVMERFARGAVKVLVSTTVIEVGVDVPRATVMVIEHAERFGLAQLHQLRGRVGRGERPSTCLLLYKGPLGEAAKARLETLRRTENGFEIAEQDLRLRGEGEMLGVQQSGLATFRIARLEDDADLLAAARDDARLIVERDPDLVGERGQALRVLLYLFERDAGVRLLRAG